MKKTKTYGFSYNKEKDKLFINESQSCYCADGVMKTGVGMLRKQDVNGNTITVASHINTVDEIFPLYITVGGVVTEFLAVLKTNGQGYYYNPSLNDGKGGWALFKDFGVKTKSINTQDENERMRTYFCNEKGVFYYISDHYETNIVKAKNVGCFYGGRIFVAVSENKLVYSSAYGYYVYKDSLEGSGYIVLPSNVGSIVAMTSFQNKLYIFCQYGIFEMCALGRPQDFTLKELDYQGGKIFGGSVGVCVASNTSGIYFYTETGFCVFDGKNIKPTCKNLTIEPMDGEQHYSHVEYEGKYHLSFLSQWGERKTLIIDCATGNGYYSFMTKGTGVIGKQGYCVMDGAIYVLGDLGAMPRSMKRTFICADVDFGEKGAKTLQVLRVRGFGETAVTVYDGNNNQKKKTFRISLDGGESSMRVFMRAEKFKLSFELDPKFKGYVESVTVDYETLP